MERVVDATPEQKNLLFISPMSTFYVTFGSWQDCSQAGGPAGWDPGQLPFLSASVFLILVSEKQSIIAPTS